MTEIYYPPAAFHFDLTIVSSPNAPWSKTEVDASFQEISGIDRELEVQALAEGGENRFAHQLPKRGKHPNLVLRRGIVSIESSLADWAEETIGADFSKPIKTRTLLVSLLSVKDTLIVWTFTNAYPVKWSTAGFKAMDNSLAIETLEMAYAQVARTFRALAAPPPPPPPPAPRPPSPLKKIVKKA
jgi:phage tail-like protein